MAGEPLSYWDYVKAAFWRPARSRVLGAMPLTQMMLVSFGLAGFVNPGFWLLGLAATVAFVGGRSASERFQKLVEAERLAAPRGERRGPDEGGLRAAGAGVAGPLPGAGGRVPRDPRPRRGGGRERPHRLPRRQPQPAPVALSPPARLARGDHRHPRAGRPPAARDGPREPQGAARGGRRPRGRRSRGRSRPPSRSRRSASPTSTPRPTTSRWWTPSSSGSSSRCAWCARRARCAGRRRRSPPGSTPSPGPSARPRASWTSTRRSSPTLSVTDFETGSVPPSARAGDRGAASRPRRDPAPASQARDASRRRGGEFALGTLRHGWPSCPERRSRIASDRCSRGNPKSSCTAIAAGGLLRRGEPSLLGMTPAASSTR